MSAAPLRLDEDAKLELSAAAQSSARRNRPLWLLFVAGAVLVVAICYALYGLYLGGVAGTRLARESSRYNEISALVEQIKKLRDEDVAGNEKYRVDQQLSAKLESAARDAGLTMTISVNEEDKNRVVKNLGVRRLTIDCKGQTSDAILQFLIKAMQSVQGLELASVKIDPGTQKTEQNQLTWSAQIKFTRWEQRGQ